MTIAASVEIHFHQQDEASVVFESSTSGEDRQKAELLMFCAFSLRQLYNLGYKEHLVVKTAELLCNTGVNIEGLVINNFYGKLKLVAHKKDSSKIKFLAKLNYSNDKLTKFWHETIESGMPEDELEYYARTAIIVLLYYFAKRYKNDRNHLYKLGLAAIECVEYSQKKELFEDPRMAGPFSSLAAFGAWHSEIDTDIMHQRSFHNVRLAAKLGNAKAQFLLGQIYEFSENDVRDLSKSAKWYRKAAEQGHAAAQFFLGDCYRTGDGVTQDNSEAAKWYRKAAEQGHAQAQYNLGMCYHVGDGVVQNNTEAIKWYTKAAEQGYGLARQVLGWNEANGEGN